MAYTNINRDAVLVKDNGSVRGRDPSTMTADDYLAAGYDDLTPLQAIRQYCVERCQSSPSEVRKCTIVECPLWPYRMGKNPFRKKCLSEEQRQAAGVRLNAARKSKKAAD